MSAATFERDKVRDLYRVSVDGETVGTVMRSWSRLVGWGWRATAAGTGRTMDYRTRAEAARALANNADRGRA